MRDQTNTDSGKEKNEQNRINCINPNLGISLRMGRWCYVI